MSDQGQQFSELHEGHDGLNSQSLTWTSQLREIIMYYNVYVHKKIK